MSSENEKKSSFKNGGLAKDGWSTDTEATATCFCGTVQLVFPLTAPGLVTTFVCHCADCHKITASMFASNFTVLDTHLKHARGQENLRTFVNSKTPISGKTMTNYFCQTCGTLMYRIGDIFPGQSILRIGTVDDFSLMEGALKPRVESFVKDRQSWLTEVAGTEQHTLL